MIVHIKASVGSGGTNRPDDVGVVQTLLNNAQHARLSVDKRCGPKTVSAIINFQKTFLSHPDGLVDPGGTTWRRLPGGAGSPFIQLPGLDSLGYYSYSQVSRQFGTSVTIETLKDIAGQFKRNSADVSFGIGDISFAGGGVMHPHKSHRDGREIDIRPLRKDKKRLPVTIFDANYSRELTTLFVETALAHANVKSILFNDTKIKGVIHWPGHDNHLHLHTKE
jgi:peptidoglycan hydrolase-like protein with peptidoglycan-binding domain